VKHKIISVNEKGYPIGEAHHRAKLSDQDVEWIRKLKEAGLTSTDIADKFQVAASTVRALCAYRFRYQFASGYRTCQ